SSALGMGCKRSGNENRDRQTSPAHVTLPLLASPYPVVTLNAAADNCGQLATGSRDRQDAACCNCSGVRIGCCVSRVRRRLLGGAMPTAKPADAARGKAP